MSSGRTVMHRTVTPTWVCYTEWCPGQSVGTTWIMRPRRPVVRPSDCDPVKQPLTSVDAVDYSTFLEPNVIIQHLQHLLIQIW